MAGAQTVGEEGEAGAGWGGVAVKGLWPTLCQLQVFFLSGISCPESWGLFECVRIQVKTL